MAAVEDVVFAKLTSIASVTALVAARVYPNVAPQKAALPYIVYSVASEERPDHAALVDATVDVTCFAADYPTVKALAAAAKRLHESPPATVAGVRVRGAFVQTVGDVYEPASDAGETGVRAIDLGVQIFFQDS